MSNTLVAKIKVHKAGELSFLRHPRDIVVYLPPGYEVGQERRYPVLYLHDGQNLFDPATAFLGNHWGLDDVAEEMIQGGHIEPLIIVGVYNAGTERMTEYTHVRDRRGRGGRARSYGKMLVLDLKPFVDSKYHTLPDARNTGLGGSSLGGLVTLYLGLHYPGVFGKLIVMSPSLWWANQAIFREIAKLRHKLPPKIWLDTGTCEGQNPQDCIRNTAELCQALVGKGWQLGRDLAYMEDEGAGHDEKAWGSRMRDALRFLFPAPV
ncbi:MAG: alpha/beta hydrolase-fold protein [Acidobacteriota bacterium]|nr:alpha/beta hydrolase-fold protein [Acidobacteriota bacterium]